MPPRCVAPRITSVARSCDSSHRHTTTNTGAALKPLGPTGCTVSTPSLIGKGSKTAAPEQATHRGLTWRKTLIQNTRREATNNEQERLRESAGRLMARHGIKPQSPRRSQPAYGLI